MKNLLLTALLFCTIAAYPQLKNVKIAEQEKLILSQRNKEIPFRKSVPLNNEQKKKLEIFNACLVKACLHRMDQASYPIVTDPSSLEQKLLKVVNKVSTAQFNKAKERIQKLATPSDPLRIQLLGNLNQLDFKKMSVTEQLPEQQYKMHSANLAEYFKLSQKLVIPKPDISGLDFIVRSLHCVDETNPEAGEDDMVLSGFVFEINRQMVTANGFFAGQFDEKAPDAADQDYPYYQSYGTHLFGAIPVNTIGYPKYFGCMLVLVEEDTDDDGQQVATDVNNALAEIGGTICDAYVPGCSLLIDEAAAMVNSIIATLFANDLFAPHTVLLTLNSKNEFGPGMESGNLATPPIYGAGGQYKVGYKWRIRQ